MKSLASSPSMTHVMVALLAGNLICMLSSCSPAPNTSNSDLGKTKELVADEVKAQLLKLKPFNVDGKVEINGELIVNGKILVKGNKVEPDVVQLPSEPGQTISVIEPGRFAALGPRDKNTRNSIFMAVQGGEVSVKADLGGQPTASRSLTAGDDSPKIQEQINMAQNTANDALKQAKDAMNKAQNPGEINGNLRINGVLSVATARLSTDGPFRSPETTVIGGGQLFLFGHAHPNQSSAFLDTVSDAQTAGLKLDGGGDPTKSWLFDTNSDGKDLRTRLGIK